MKKRLLFAAAVLCGLPLAAAAPAALPEAARAPFEKGLAAVRQQEWSLAARYFEEARAAAPDAADVLYNQGLAEARIVGRELRAIALLRATIAAEPASSRKKAIEGEIQSLEVKSEAALQKLGQQARELASKLPADQQAYAYATVARSQARAGDLQGARATAELLTGNDRQSAYGGVVSGLLDAGDVVRAKDLMNYTLDYASERARLVELQAKTGDLAGAQSSLHYVREEDRPGVSLTIGKAMAAGGKTADAKKLFADARAATLKQKFILANGLTTALVPIVEAQAEAADIEGAIETAARLEADPRDGKCESTIYYCSPRDRAQWAIAHGRMARARTLAAKKDFAGARRDAEQVPADVFVAGMGEDYDSCSLRDKAWEAIRSGAVDDYWMGYRNDRAALRKVVEGLPPESRQSINLLSASGLEELPEQLVALDLEARDFAAARSVIALAGTVPMRVRLAGRVAEGLAKAGKVAEAREVASAAKADALAMRESRKVPALGKSRVDKARLSWVRGAAAAGMMAQAEEALPLLDEAGRKEGQEAITGGWVASGDVTRALAAIERMAAGYGRDSALGNLATKLIAAGDLASAEKVVAKAEGADSTKHELSKAHADRGDFVAASRISSGITDKDYKRWAENHRVEKQIAANLMEPDRSAVRATAEDAMARAEATATGVEDPMLRAGSLRTVAAKWRDLRRREDALRVDRLAALAIGAIADGCERAGAQLAVATALEEDGDVVGSREAWESARVDASACTKHQGVWAATALGKRDERGAREILGRQADAEAALKAMADLAIARTPPDVQTAKRFLALVGADGQRIAFLAVRQAGTGDFTGAVTTMKTMPPADTSWSGYGWKYVCIAMMEAGKHAEAKALIVALSGGVRAEVLPCLGAGPDADWAFEQARALPERSKLMKEIAIARVEKDAAGAQRMLAAVETSGTPEDAREVALALAGAGHVEAAVRLGPPTADPQWYWKQLAEGHAKRGRGAEARAALKKVNATPRAVADVLLRHGLAQDARADLDVLCPPAQAECAGFADGFIALRAPANWPATPAELARITDAGTKDFMLRATIAVAVGRGEFARAVEWAAAAPEQDRPGVLAPIVTAALAAQKTPLVKSAVEKLPDGPARGWLLLDIARVTTGPQQGPILAAARKGAGGSPMLTAAIDDTAQRAKRPAPETALIAVVAGKKGTAATVPSKGDEARQQRVQEWGYLVDSTRNGMLTKPVFTDFAAHLQSIANKPTAREVVGEFCSAMDAISQAREAIAELAKKQRT